MTLSHVLLAVGLTAVAAAPAAAQQRDSGRANTRRQPTTVPSDARPPKGMCRVWINGVPAGQQPAVTDCQAAVRNRPQNARVLFGDDYADTARTKRGESEKLPPGAKQGFSPEKRPVVKKPPQ